MDNNNKQKFHVEPQKLPKTPTNIQGLDDVLHGGLPTGRLTIISGGAGAGKTIMGLELLTNGAEAGYPAVFISFEETSESIRRNALSLGWDLAKVEKEGKLAMINPEINYNAVAAGDFSIEGFFAILEGQAKRIGAKIIIIDAADMLMRLFDDPKRARDQMVSLNRWLSEQKLTAIMTVKSTESLQKEYDYLDFMADCVIKIDQRVQEQVTTRRLHVTKFRGSGFASREHPFVITRKGIVVMPLSFIDLVQQATGEFVSTSNKELDAILGGGYRKSSSILVSGPSGSGKTTLAFTLSIAAAQRGERVLYLSFEQSEAALISEMKSVGLDIEALTKKGNLRITPVLPESMGMEEHLHRIITEVEEYKPAHLVVDAISATERIGSPQAAKEFLIRLYYNSKKRGITCIYTNQLFNSQNEELEVSGMGISSFVDTAIILSFYREKSQIKRTILVLKSRGTRHSNRYHELKITDDGLKISEFAND